MTDLPTKDSEGNHLEKDVWYEVHPFGESLPFPHLFQAIEGNDYLFKIDEKNQIRLPLSAVDSLRRYGPRELEDLAEDYVLRASLIKEHPQSLSKSAQEAHDAFHESDSW